MKTYRYAQGVAAMLVLLLLISCFVYTVTTDLQLRDGVRESLARSMAPGAMGTAVQDVTATVEKAFENSVSLKEAFAYLQRVMGKREIKDFQYVKADSGQLLFGSFYDPVPSWYLDLAMEIRKLSDYAAIYGAQTLFINVPDIFVRGETTIPEGIPAYDRNAHQDALLYHLQSLGVDTLDMRTALLDTSLSPDRYIYKTDYRWTNEAAFEAFVCLVDILNTRYNAQLDPEGIYCDKDQYEITTYASAMLGSLGRSAGLPYSGTEDLTVILPTFETRFVYEQTGQCLGRETGTQTQIGNSTYATKRISGSFADTLFNSGHVSAKTPYTGNSESVYLNDLAGNSLIQNELMPEGKRVLFLCDSYALPLAAFLASTVGEVRIVRINAPIVMDRNLDVKSLIRDGQFDYVLVEQFPGNFDLEVFQVIMAGETE